MRRTYISPEFTYNKVYGTFNMLEESTFFGSKMLKVDPTISVLNNNIIYYQQPTGEQLNLNSEESLPQVIYNAVNDKQINSSLSLDTSQGMANQLGNASWILTIQLNTILSNYIYALLKTNRTFEGVTDEMTLNQHVDDAITDYINKNVLNLYKFDHIDMFLVSVPLTTLGGLQYNNQFDQTIENTSNIFTKFSTTTDPNGIDVVLNFNQPNPASQWAFNYYYNLYFNRI